LRRTRAANPSGAAPPIKGECADIEPREVMLPEPPRGHFGPISLFELFFDLVPHDRPRWSDTPRVPTGNRLTGSHGRSETGARFSGGSETRAPGIRTSFTEERRVDTGWTLAWVRDRVADGRDGPSENLNSVDQMADDLLTKSLFGLPEEDAAEALRRVNAERDALALEQSRMEQRFNRKNAARAAFIRDALATTPSLKAALIRSGAVDRDEDLGALAEQLLTAPLTDADPNDPESESLHEMLGTLREAYTARRGDHSGLLGELAARRQGLEKRQR